MAGQRKPRRGWLVALLALVVLAAVAGWFMTQDHPAQDTRTPQYVRPTGVAAPPTTTTSPARSCAITWFSAPDLTPVPRSDCAGPATVTATQAKGFSHDQLGAVIAAINITTRITSAAGPTAYRATLAEQTVGDTQTALTDVAGEQSDSAANQTRPDHWWYRIGAGDPSGDLVEVDLIASTPQTRAQNEYAALSTTVRWVDGDWKVQLPRPRATPITSAAGYTSLGTTTTGGS